MDRSWRLLSVCAAAILLAATATSQVIEFESAGLKYQALTKDGLTIMVAPLNASVRDYTVVQVAVSNGGRNTLTLKPEDFTYLPDAGIEIPALPARTVVYSLIERASRSDVVKLVDVYEAGLYGNMQPRSTNGFDYRRQNALTDFTSTRLKAAATASAVAFVQTRLAPGQSTDGAVFYALRRKPFASGVLRVRAGGSVFEFPVVSSN
ncbi:MAG TPA: hypothetical protein VER03_00640 [Bryobacteraceae bacterium]|nr:hypothetical protein [Bryobacteraceae bacterium]